MTPANPLLSTYQEWLEIVRAEQKIIREERWAELNAFTARKNELIRAIQEIESDEAWREKLFTEEIRILVHQLRDMEQLNHTLISQRMEEVKMKLEDVARRKQVLQMLRTRYRGFGAGNGRPARGEA